MLWESWELTHTHTQENKKKTKSDLYSWSIKLFVYIRNDVLYSHRMTNRVVSYCYERIIWLNLRIFCTYLYSDSCWNMMMMKKMHVFVYFSDYKRKANNCKTNELQNPFKVVPSAEKKIKNSPFAPPFNTTSINQISLSLFLL